MSDTTKSTDTKAPPGAAPAVVGAAATEDLPVPIGGTRLPVGGIELDVGTDVTSQLNSAIPAFGNVLASIGNGVAASQKALDQGVVTTVTALNGKNITVVTDVIEVLNDDGLPDASKTQLVTQSLSVLNFFTPTVHEWKQVAIAMDLEVGSFSSSQGLQFSSDQTFDKTTTTGLFWGFLGWTSMNLDETTTDISDTTTHEVAWQQGQVRVDAILGPRNTSKFPVPDSISIGPQIFVTQGAVTTITAGGVTTGRSIDLQIQVRKADGTPNPAKNIVINAGGLLPSFTGGSATDATGLVKATLTRNLPAGSTDFQKFSIIATLGQISKTFSVTL